LKLKQSKKIEEKEGIPSTQQILILKGKEFEDEITIYDYKLYERDYPPHIALEIKKICLLF